MRSNYSIIGPLPEPVRDSLDRRRLSVIQHQQELTPNRRARQAFAGRGFGKAQLCLSEGVFCVLWCRNTQSFPILNDDLRQIGPRGLSRIGDVLQQLVKA